MSGKRSLKRISLIGFLGALVIFLVIVSYVNNREGRGSAASGDIAHRVYALLEQGDLDEARSILVKARYDEGSAYNAYYWLGNIELRYTDPPNLDLAKDCYLKALGNKRTAEVLMDLADVYFREGNVKKAESHFEEALEKEPNNERALMNYAGMLWRQKRHAEAADMYARGVKVNPENSYAIKSELACRELAASSVE